MHGEPLKGYKHWFEDAVAEAGLSDFTWYCLRHTFAPRLVMAGAETIAELLGHRMIQMTMRYAHLPPEHKLAAIERLVGRGRQAKHLTPELTPRLKSSCRECSRSELSRL
jgi:integrase